MPLRAKIDNKDIISFDHSDEEWSDLKAKVKCNKLELILPCCGKNGFLRTSKLGLKHFVHSKSDNCSWEHESPEHLRAKQLIIEACRECGWDAVPEFSESNWRADVLATKDGKRIAFEVQWSKQTYIETNDRTEKYEKSNVRVCWFFRKIPTELEYYPIKRIPAFFLYLNENQFNVKLGKHIFSLKEFVNNLLQKKIKYCKQFKANQSNRIIIDLYRYKCYRCGSEQYIHSVGHISLDNECCKDMSISLAGTIYANHGIDYHPLIIQKVEETVNSEFEHMSPGPIMHRYYHYFKCNIIAYGCYKCGSIFAPYHIYKHIESMNSFPEQQFKTTLDLKLPLTRNFCHWCFSSENKQFCE